MSVSVLSVKMLPLNNTNDVYKLNFNTFQLQEGVIPLDILHKVNHNTPQYLNIPIFNANNCFCSISRCSPLATLVPAGKYEEIQKVSWNQVHCDNAKILPEIPEGTSLQLEPVTKSALRSIPDADIPEDTRVQLQELLDWKYTNIISQTAMGPPITSKPYTVPLKYPKFLDHENKQLEKVGIISRSMSDWASPFLVVPKKEEHAETSNNTSGSKNSKFNM